MQDKYIVAVTTGVDVVIDKTMDAVETFLGDLGEDVQIELQMNVDENLQPNEIIIKKTLI